MRWPERRRPSLRAECRLFFGCWQNSLLPLGFDFTGWHGLQLSWRGDAWRFALDGGSAQSRTVALRGPLRPALVTEDARAAFRIAPF